MNAQSIVTDRIGTGRLPIHNQAERGSALEDAIHHLAQPLTALLFIVEMGRLQSSPELWKASLDSAGDECRRAVAALDAVRSAAAAVAADRGGTV